MAGQVPAKRNNEVTDPTLAANVNKELSYSQRAVDARGDAVAVPAIANAIEADPGVRDRVANLVESIVDVTGLSAANIAIDTDGTPFFDPGNRTYFLGFDFDGTPYFTNGA